MKWKILVIGDTCKDVYVYGDCIRLCPDAPVPVLIPQRTVESEGMSGNIISNLSVLDVESTQITNKVHITKTRYVDEKTNQMLVRVDTGENGVERIKNMDQINFNGYDAVIISDYCKGFLFEEDIEFICKAHSNVFVDTKKQIDKFCKKAKFIKINETEYNFSKKTIDNINIEDILIVTLGSGGARYSNKIFPVEKVDIKDQTGAGDTFMATLVLKYLETKNIKKAIIFANKCATYVVQKRGVVSITKDLL